MSALPNLRYGLYAFKPLPKYTHLSAEDAEVWGRFVAAHPSFFDYVTYDARVGQQSDLLEGSDLMTGRLAAMLLRKRIDAVGVKGSEVWVCEVKPRLSFTAIGQLLVYAWHLSIEAKLKSKPRMLAVGGSMDGDCEPIYAVLGIKVVIV